MTAGSAAARGGSAQITLGRTRRLPDIHSRGFLTVALLLAVAWSATEVDWRDGAVRTGGLSVLGDLVEGLLHPDLSAETVERAISGAWITVVYAVAGLALAVVGGFPLGILASGVLTPAGNRRRASIAIGRALLAALRSMHELVWAWLFVVALGISPFAAVFAIAVPYAGILGRIYADLLNDVPAQPLRALRVAGGGEMIVLLYGRLAMALPNMVSYTFYRFECALRAAAIMGFVGLGGLGFEIELALDDLRYESVATYLIALIALVAGVEVWSNLVRKDLVR